jgi:hypothetical protein
MSTEIIIKIQQQQLFSPNHATPDGFGFVNAQVTAVRKYY